jgi:hypothetical protein
LCAVSFSRRADALNHRLLAVEQIAPSNNNTCTRFDLIFCRTCWTKVVVVAHKVHHRYCDSILYVPSSEDARRSRTAYTHGQLQAKLPELLAHSNVEMLSPQPMPAQHLRSFCLLRLLQKQPHHVVRDPVLMCKCEHALRSQFSSPNTVTSIILAGKFNRPCTQLSQLAFC